MRPIKCARPDRAGAGWSFQVLIALIGAHDEPADTESIRKR